MSDNRKRIARNRRHRRIRKKVFGTPVRPRLCVFKSIKHIYAQVVDDTSGNTLVFVGSTDKELRGSLRSGGNAEAAKTVGNLLAKRAIERGLKQVVFDRGGYMYHGRVKTLAEAARVAGLKF